MEASRRRILRLAAGVAVLTAASHRAKAQGYPTRPAHIMVGFSAGSAYDILGRLVGQWLSERLGQPFVVENRPGADGNFATSAVVRARPDGYTLLVTGSSDAVNATLYGNLNFKFIRDIAPVAGIGRAPNVLVVHPSFPARTIPEFIAYAKANPGRISMASSGIGSSSHLSGELFKMMAGVDLVHVAYRGQASALTDLLGGQVQMDFATMPPAIEYVRTGKLRALAVTGAMRSEALPDLPTVGEFLPGYETGLLTGLGVPRNTPVDIIEKLNKEINNFLADPRMKARLADLGNTALLGSSADFGNLLADETEKWARVIQVAKIKAE